MRRGVRFRSAWFLVALLLAVNVRADPKEVLAALRQADYPGAAGIARNDRLSAPPESHQAVVAGWGLARALYAEARLQEAAHRAVPRLLNRYGQKALGPDEPALVRLTERLDLVRQVLPGTDQAGPELELALSGGRIVTMPDPLAPGARARALYREAAPLLEEVSRTWPRARPLALHLAGRARRSLGDLPGAIRDLEAAEPPRGAPDLLLALTAAGRGAEADALVARMAEVEEPGSSPIWMAAMIRVGRWSSARGLRLLEGLEGLPESTEARLACAELARAAGPEAEAGWLDRAYDHAGRDDLARNDPELVLARALLLMERGLPGYPEALGSLLALAERFPELGVLHRAAQGIYAAAVRRGGEQLLQDGT